MSAAPLYPAAGRLGELRTDVQDAIRLLIGGLASAGSLISSDEQITIISRLYHEVSELTRERMREESDDESNDESDDESEGWEDTYQHCLVDDELIGDHLHLQQFKETHEGDGEHRVSTKTYYHQTYGGGPEGGYFVKTVYPSLVSGNDTQEFIYEVSRTWGEPFTAVLLPGKILEVRNFNVATGLAQIRVVDDESASG